MEAEFGPTWWKARLKSDEQKRPFTESIQYEREHNWMSMISHHPVYYLLLTDLKDVIFKRDNWREVFSSVFADDTVIRGSLTEIEPIRNKIAHNRTVSETDVRILEASLEKITGMVGNKRFAELSSRKTHVANILAQIQTLEAEANLAIARIRGLEPLLANTDWPMILDAWWFESEYLGVEITPIRILFSDIDGYTKLPRARGRIFEIEAWVRARDFESKFQEASRAFKVLSDSNLEDQ